MGGGAISIVTWDDTVWADLPDREEAGSPNVIGAVALGVAIETLIELGFDEMLQHEVELGSSLLSRLSRIPGVGVLGGPDAAPAPGARLASFVVEGSTTAWWQRPSATSGASPSATAASAPPVCLPPPPHG